MIHLLFALTLISTPDVEYQGLLGGFLPYNAYHFVDLIEDGDFSYARNDFITAESTYQQAYNYALKINNYKLLTVSLISIGTVLGKQEKTEAALEKFKQALNNKDIIFNDSILSVLYYDLGVAYYKHNQLDSAIISYTNAIELDSNYINAYKNRGLAYYQQTEYANATENYNQVLHLKSDYTDVMVMMAEVYLAKNDHVSAKHWYERALQNKELLVDFSEKEIKEKITELSKFIRE
jgi:tetratricopeptide (TPR) repeat protein